MAQSEAAIWIDGEPSRSLPLPDRGLDFGDGLFETLLLYRGQALYLDRHLQRLERGISRLGFPASCLTAVNNTLNRVLSSAGSPAQWSALRLTLTRGAGPRGYAPPENPTPRVIISLLEIPGPEQFPAPLSLALADIAWPHQPRLAGIKHLNRLEQVLAAAQARADGVDDVLMLDTAGAVCSLSAANLFLVEGDRLVTPFLVQCGIAGTRRELILEHWAPALGLAVSEETFELPRLLAADEVFCSNALVGVRPVGSLKECSWSDFSTCRALHRKMLEELPC